MRQTTTLIVLLWLLTAAAAPLCAVEAGDVRNQQLVQQQAHAMARELVSGVLELQLRQLRENGLRELPIYGEIESMRDHLDELVRDEMAEVIRLLVEAQQGDQEHRLSSFDRARVQIREVMISLLAERQRLRLRLRIARLAAQVDEIIQLQEKTRTVTGDLPETAQPRRERLTVETIKRQQFVARLYFQLKETLAEVSQWSGDIGAGAADALRIARAAQIENELSGAEEQLKIGNFTEAANRQQSVIQGLQAVLERIDEARSLGPADREATLAMVTELIQRQQELRTLTDQTDLTAETADPLVKKETRIHKDLGTLADALQSFPSCEGLTQQAKAAAFQAVADLFRGDKNLAVAQQAKVISALKEIQQIIQRAIELERADKSAEQLAQEARRLEQLKNRLQKITQQQANVVENAIDHPAEAKESQRQIAQQLAKIDPPGDLSGAIQSRLVGAAEAVSDSMQALENSDSPARQRAASAARDSLRQALAETQVLLADTLRRQLAVEVGELARAAEALERAASAEKRIAQLASQAAETDGFEASQAARLATQHRDVAHVAEKIQQGVRRAAPSVADLLEQSSKPIAEAGKRLQEAIDHPGEASKPAAKAVALQTSDIASRLEKAAAALRSEQGAVSEKLTELANRQLQQVDEVLQPLDRALADAEQGEAKSVTRLREALDKVYAAQALQQRASGHSAAADACELANRIKNAQEKQRLADAAATQLASGQANTPLSAATRQQEAAEAIQELAQRAEGSTQKALQQAAMSASQAARELLTGDSASAAAYRKQARESLASAAGSAEQAADVAAREPAGELNAAAQRGVGQIATEAEKLTGKLAPEASQALQEAQQHSSEAEQHIDSGEPDSATAAQRQTRERLTSAAERLRNALQDASQDQVKELDRQADRASQLAEQASNVDPGAASALRQAEKSARDGSQGSPETPSHRPSQQTSQARDNVHRNLERATASLAQRQQQIRQDRDIAEVMAKLAKEQQLSRDEIASQAATLDKLAKDNSSSGGQGDNTPPAPEQVAAAQALDSATQRFAEAQRATGQGAAEISGQREVANQPIREGLQTASRLRGDEPQSPTEGEGQNQGEGEPAQEGQGEGEGQSSSEGQGQGQGEGQGEGQGQGDGQGQGEGDEQGQGLGTGLVPSSPKETAQQIAGSQAMSQASQTLAQAKGQTESQQPDQSGSGQTGAAGEVAGDEASAENQPPEGSPLVPNMANGDRLERAAGSDTATIQRRFEQQPWFAKLPPELRNAIQANARRRPPRGYEERLRRYFESAD